ncbi:MAG: hypothetical protein RL341_1628 [Pseudomonadota bacterium]|jgi:hypothetical protein
MQQHRLFIIAGALGLAAAGLLVAGPIAQPDHYHAFADTRAWLGIPNTADVLSNLPFLIVGILGLLRAAQVPQALQLPWRLLSIALRATCFGSAFYHWAPADFGLLIDRIPVALACVAIALMMLADRVSAAAVRPLPLAVMSLLAVTSCLYWYFTQTAGHGDLRPYIFLQGLPMLLVPLLTLLYPGGTIRGSTWWTVLLLYAAAKLCEVLDHQMLDTLSVISGHTLKHLFAAAAAWVLIHTDFRKI